MRRYYKMSSGTKIKSNECSTKPTLTFTQKAWEKMWALTKIAKDDKKKAFECTSFGIMDSEDPCRVTDLWVPDQENTGSSTEADDDSMLEWMLEVKAEGIDMGQLTFWQHSHADMDVFFSSTDLATIRRMECDHIQWSVVTNMAGEILVRADIFSPIRYWWSSCEYEVEYPEIAGIQEWSAAQKEKMTLKVPAPKKWGKHNNHVSNNRTLWAGAGGTTGYGSHFDSNEHPGYGWHGYHEGFTVDAKEDTSPEESDNLVGSNNQPCLVFTHNDIQDAYDENLITVKEAERLDHALCLGSKTRKEVEEELDWLIKAATSA
jgi:hypothetical protein